MNGNFVSHDEAEIKGYISEIKIYFKILVVGSMVVLVVEAGVVVTGRVVVVTT